MTTTASPANDHAIQQAAYDLRLAGNSSRAIGSILGLSESVAYRAVHNFAARTGAIIPGAARHAAAVRASHEARRGQGWNCTRRFGVEIEVVGLSLQEAYEAIRNVVNTEDPGGSYNYHHRVTEGTWKVVTDGSVSGAEIVSPPLAGRDGEEQVKAVMQALRAAGGRTNISTGLHVHHEVEDLTGAQIAHLIRLYVGQQATMDSLVAPSRRNQTWCAHFAGREADRFAEAFELIDRASTTATTRRQAIQSHGIGGRPDSRYRVVNVHSYPTYGTIEFRQHQGTLNATKAISWIRLGQAMIQAAINGTSVTAPTGSSFLAHLRDSTGLPAYTHNYLASRIDRLAA